MSVIEFRFKRKLCERDFWYTLKDLAAFEEGLLLARRQDKQLDHDLRIARKEKEKDWIKLRNEELYPLFCFAKKIHLAEDTEFQICEEGADADLELRSKEGVRRLQITLAGPIWPGGEENWGKSHKFCMEKLNSEGQTSGWGPFRKASDGSISNREEMITTEERDSAYYDGLVKALEGKQNHRIPDCDLIIRAVAYCEAMNQQTFVNLANAALSEVSLSNFRSLYILDYGEGYFVERNERSLAQPIDLNINTNA